MTWEQEMKHQRWEAYEEGLSEGVQQAARENAKNLLKLGVEVDTVAKGCSLPLEEVLALKEQLTEAEKA